MFGRHLIFLINLLQDVSVVRPLAYLAARELECTISFLISDKFLSRDFNAKWLGEIHQICRDTGASVAIYDSPFAALSFLSGKRGVIVAGSESSLSAHQTTHDVFRTAPSGLVKVTLQHGLECVGFMQSHDHNLKYGRDVTFAADIICGWCEPAALRSVAPSERSKLYVTGPSIILNKLWQPDRMAPADALAANEGLVCENMHSVRLSAQGDFKVQFLEIFRAYCDRLKDHDERVSLRPHPGGQYVLKNSVALPENVTLANEPIYRTDLTRYAYGISAPSTVILDMVLAGIPTAVWTGGDWTFDAENYEGLTFVSSVDEWMTFRREAETARDLILARQDRYLSGLQMPTDPVDIYRRFARLLANGTAVKAAGVAARVVRKILFVANGVIPTLQLSFLKPLAALVDAGLLDIQIVTEQEMGELFRKEAPKQKGEDWTLGRVRDIDPDLIIFCRYSGPHYAAILEFAREKDIPVLLHIDDDLLNVPKEIGEKKFKAHNRPERVGAIRTLLEETDMVYCSTPLLKERFRELGFGNRMIHGPIYCAGTVLVPAERRPIRKVGYMGFDHAHDLESVLPALVRFMKSNTDVTFELFGSIPLPDELAVFGDRVVVLPPVRVYEEFLKFFSELGWDIGICPLVKTHFNMVKANTKWVEYTSIGAAVIATRGMAYDDCASADCGLLVDGVDEWEDALLKLSADPDRRYDLVRNAQTKLELSYSVDSLRAQIGHVVNQIGMMLPGLPPKHAGSQLQGYEVRLAASGR